jgi:hypothetical protein
MEKPDINGEQMRLFDHKRYVEHHFILPNVVELRPLPVENTGHDTFAEDVEADELRAKIFDFPRRLEPPDRAA